MAAQGASVVVNYRTSAAEAEGVAAEIVKLGPPGARGSGGRFETRRCPAAR